jgi:ubiquinone/menaquinone biosynthesis C-methylase UbiE
MTNKKNNIEDETRRVFHDLHLRHLENTDSTDRFRNLLSTEMLNEDKGYFKDKTCGDIGCGSSIPGCVQLLDLGAKFVHGMDLDDSFKKSAIKILKSNKEYNSRWKLDIGSLSSLPYKDNSFDFILCHGVIHHVEDDQKALNELHRILKDNGKAYITVVGEGGLFNRMTMSFMRDEYKNTALFREFIDNQLTTSWIKESLLSIKSNMDKDDSESFLESVSFMSSLPILFDEDFILSLKDVLQAPIYKNYKENEFKDMLLSAGFKSFHRVPKKPIYNNVRRILAPLYYEYDSDLSRLLYGDGYLNMVVTK